MVNNFFANSCMRLPGQTIGNIDQDINYIKGKKGKGRKAKARATTTATTTTKTTTTATTTTTINNNHYGKGPIGSYDYNNNKGKNNHAEGRQEQKGQRKLYLYIEVLDLLQSWTSSSRLLVQQPEECQQHPAAATTSTISAISATRINQFDKNYFLPHSLRLLPGCPLQDQPSTTSMPSKRPSVKEINHRTSGTTVTSSTSTS